MPTDATLAAAADVEFEAVPLETVRTAVAGATKLRLVILDACRNNPFKLASDGTKRSVGRGLARVEPGANEIVAYSAKEGTVAADGDGSNSPFAAALVKHLVTPGLEVNFLFRRVRDDVLTTTGRTQEPFTYGTLGAEEVYLNPPLAAAAEQKSEPAPPLSEAAQIWPTIEATTSCGVLDSFVARFPGSVYADFAKARQMELRCGNATAVSEGNAVVIAYPDLGTSNDEGALPEASASGTDTALVVPADNPFSQSDDASACGRALVSVGSGAGKRETCLKPGEKIQGLRGVS